MKKINITIDEKKYAQREQIKTLRTNIQFCGDDKKVIMVTSCLPGEGKTEISIELAKSFAEMGKKVILLDLDIRKSVMLSRLNIGTKLEGVSHFLSGQCTFSDTIVATNIPGLHLVLAGPAVPNPTELLESKRFMSMIEALRGAFDYVIIDCPPLGLVIDAAIIAKQCDGSIIVLESGETKYRLAQQVKAKLERAEVPILGVVLNKVEMKKNKGYYSKYYGTKYGEYYGNDSSKPKKRKQKDNI